MIRPESDFLRSFAALERSIRALPDQHALLPLPRPPDPALLDAWLEPYRDWELPQVYLDFLAHYGGVTVNVPAIGIGIRPLPHLLEYRRERAPVLPMRVVPLSPGNIDGALNLVFSDAGEPRVALMMDVVSYVADSFALFLWSACFFVGAVHSTRFREGINFQGLAPKDIEPFNLRVAEELERAGFELLGADSRVICCQREGTRVHSGMRGPNIWVSLGNNGSLHAVSEARADVLALLERCR